MGIKEGKEVLNQQLKGTTGYDRWMRAVGISTVVIIVCAALFAASIGVFYLAITALMSFIGVVITNDIRAQSFLVSFIVSTLFAIYLLSNSKE